MPRVLQDLYSNMPCKVNMKIILSLIMAALFLVGCATPKVLTLMPRDSGKTYTGIMARTGSGVGSVTITIDQTTYNGSVVVVGSNETFGFATAFGSNSRGSTANAYGASFADGDQFAKAILSSSDGKGLRCDLTGRSSGGGGICVDDQKRIYDVIFVPQ